MELDYNHIIGIIILIILFLFVTISAIRMLIKYWIACRKNEGRTGYIL